MNDYQLSRKRLQFLTTISGQNLLVIQTESIDLIPPTHGLKVRLASPLEAPVYEKSAMQLIDVWCYFACRNWG
jgi:hypothetical protein